MTEEKLEDQLNDLLHWNKFITERIPAEDVTFMDLFLDPETLDKKLDEESTETSMECISKMFTGINYLQFLSEINVMHELYKKGLLKRPNE